MSDPVPMTLAEARDALKARKISSTELTSALVRFGRTVAKAQCVRDRNAGPRAGDGRGFRCAAGERRGRRPRRPAAGDQGSFLHQGREDHGGQPDPGQFHSALRIHRHPEFVERRRGPAGQDQHGRIRHGFVQRDQRLGPGVQSLAGARTATPIWCRAVRPAVRPRRWLAISVSPPPVPIPAARSASLPR